MSALAIGGLFFVTDLLALALLVAMRVRRQRRAAAARAVAQAVREARAERADFRAWALELEAGMSSDEIAARRRALCYLTDSELSHE